MNKLINDEYKAIRGFNYQPSYASHGLQIWGDSFNLDVIKKELEVGKQHFPGINTIRLWLSFDAFLQCPKSFGRKFDSVIDLGEDLEIRFVPTLFNGWHSLPDFGGISVEMVGYWGVGERFAGAFHPYIESVVKPHANDDRILLWDLCNEPFNNARCDSTKQVILGWLKRVYQVCKQGDPSTPISVGSTSALDLIKLVEPISDVITFHPYHAWTLLNASVECFEKNINGIVAFANSVDKALLVTETGWGALEDQKRAETLVIELGILKKYDIGFLAHLLCHTLVADGHRPEYGPITAAGYMAFIESDGSIRPYHDVFNKY